jgi:hypothetical protein
VAVIPNSETDSVSLELTSHGLRIAKTKRRDFAGIKNPARAEILSGKHHQRASTSDLGKVGATWVASKKVLLEYLDGVAGRGSTNYST